MPVDAHLWKVTKLFCISISYLLNKAVKASISLGLLCNERNMYKQNQGHRMQDSIRNSQEKQIYRTMAVLRGRGTTMNHRGDEACIKVLCNF